MIGKPYALRTIYIVTLILLAFHLQAQPTLPDLAAVSKDGVNLLTWNCQYEGLKSIAVKRAKDSMGAYSTVGYVKDLKRGIQVFADGHPMPGNNWYQLSITFSSDLGWTSNRIKLHVDSSTLLKQQVILPPNDSLQQFVSATDKPADKKKNHKKQAEPEGKIVVTLDSTQKGVTTSEKATNNVAATDSVKEKRHITISLGNSGSDMNPYSYMKAEHVYTDLLTGHIKLEMPDVKKHVYAIKFYNDQNEQVIEVPHLSTSPIIMDKRNFNKKAIYKFILKRDNAAYETGYITVY